MARESDFPILRAKISRWRVVQIMLIIVATMVFFGLIAHGDIVDSRMPPEFAGFWVIVLAACAIFFAVKFSKVDFDKPITTVTADGINRQKISKFIPWSAVEKIETYRFRRVELLYVTLKQEADATLLAELARLNRGLSPRTIIISPKGFEGFSPERVKSLVYEYFRRHNTAGNDAMTGGLE